jgi:hypothetical protein
MNMIYTVTVAMSQRVEFMGGRMMHASITGEKTCNFATVEEADRFATMMKDKGYEVEIGLVKATAEAWAAEVEQYHAKLGSTFGRPVLSKTS